MRHQTTLHAKEAQLHDSEVQSIANQYHVEEQEVRALYDAELRKIAQQARISTFLSVLCVRHVKEHLLHAAHEGVIHA